MRLGLQSKIEIHLERKGNFLHLSVTDDGPGYPVRLIQRPETVGKWKKTPHTLVWGYTAARYYVWSMEEHLHWKTAKLWRNGYCFFQINQKPWAFLRFLFYTLLYYKQERFLWTLKQRNYRKSTAARPCRCVGAKSTLKLHPAIYFIMGPSGSGKVPYPPAVWTGQADFRQSDIRWKRHLSVLMTKNCPLISPSAHRIYLQYSIFSCADRKENIMFPASGQKAAGRSISKSAYGFVRYSWTADPFTPWTFRRSATAIYDVRSL